MLLVATKLLVLIGQKAMVIFLEQQQEPLDVSVLYFNKLLFYIVVYLLSIATAHL